MQQENDKQNVAHPCNRVLYSNKHKELLTHATTERISETHSGRNQTQKNVL